MILGGDYADDTAGTRSAASRGRGRRRLRRRARGRLGAGDGVAYVVLGPVTSDATMTGYPVITGSGLHDALGNAAAGGGDLDGDGYDDVVVGNSRGGASFHGRAYVFYGPLASSEPAAGANVTVSGDTNSDYAGYSLAMLGDTDGDGLDDFLVGVRRDDGGASAAGAAALVLGPGT